MVPTGTSLSNGFFWHALVRWALVRQNYLRGAKRLSTKDVAKGARPQGQSCTHTQVQSTMQSYNVDKVVLK